jgi:hypothetical protein
MFSIAQQYGRKSNNKRPHVATDSSSSSYSEMSINSSRLASPTPSSPDLFYLETKQLPSPKSLSPKTLQFGTAETIPTALFKDKQLEDGESSSEDQPLIPGTPFSSKVPAQIQIKVEHFENVINARESEAKANATPDASTTAATSNDSDKENKTPYSPTTLSMDPAHPAFSNSEVGRDLQRIYNALRYFSNVVNPKTSCERSTWSDSEDEEIEDDSSDDWGKPNPADKFPENAGAHPGEGWHLNDPLTPYYYPVEIFNPDNYDRINAPYLTFSIHRDHAEVSATYGKGYPIITRTLTPVPVDYFCPPLTPEQIEILDPKIGFADAVKRIIDDHFPLHLSAAIQRYQYFKHVQYKSQKEIQRLKEKEYRYMEKAIGELSGLENANVLGRLVPHEHEILQHLADDQYESGHLLSLLRSYQGPIAMSGLDPRANPFRPGATRHHLHPEDAAHKVPLDPDLEYCDKHRGLRRSFPKGHARMCSKERNHRDVENRLQDDADYIEDTLRDKLHQRRRPCIKRCFKCHKHGHIRAECPNRRQPWHARK